MHIKVRVVFGCDLKRSFTTRASEKIVETLRLIAICRRTCVSVCGWYEISIPAAPCHCVLCFRPKLDSLLVLKGCYLNIAIHGALQEKRCVFARLFQISGHFKMLWSATVRFLYKLKKPSEKIAGTLPDIAFYQGQRVFTSQWSFTPNNFKQKQQRRTDSKTREIHGEHGKNILHNKVALQFGSKQSCSLGTGVLHRRNTGCFLLSKGKKEVAYEFYVFKKQVNTLNTNIFYVTLCWGCGLCDPKRFREKDITTQ